MFVLLGDVERYAIQSFHLMKELIANGHVKTLAKNQRYRAVFAVRGNAVSLGGYDITHCIDKWDSII